MRKFGRKVIKSEEVKFFNAEGDQDPSSAGYDWETSRKAVAEKVRIAEQEGYERGVSEGIAKGREMEKKQTIQSVQAMSTIVKEMAVLKKNAIESMEEEIVKLSLAVAEKVIHLETTTNREVIRSVLKDAINEIADRENINIRLNPKDYKSIIEIKNDFLQGFDGLRNVAFVEDESIKRGGAIIETVCGEVDARLEQQHSEIKAAFCPAD